MQLNVSANCFTIVTVDDDIFEISESFNLEVQTLTMFFFGTLTILDNDSKLHKHMS